MNGLKIQYIFVSYELWLRKYPYVMFLHLRGNNTFFNEPFLLLLHAISLLENLKDSPSLNPSFEVLHPWRV